MKPSQAALVVASTLSGVQAHSHVTNIVINGDSYDGFNTKTPTNPAVLAGWSTTVGPEDGWIGTKNYGTPDMACHLGAANAQGYAPVEAGDTIHFQWMGWPESHKGSAVTYLARCGGEDDSAAACAEVDKADLEFFKIGAGGLLDPKAVPSEHATAKGLWASDVIIANNNTWAVEIPPAVAPGFYVLRHELIALHYATDPAMGPQHYPQCLTVRIVGGAGTEVPRGVRAAELYRKDDPGLVYDVFRDELPAYPVPGPAVMEGVPDMVKQTGATVLKKVPAVPAYPKVQLGRS
ncbi:Endoglucanase-4 [Paramyrothecium foliicola]|nr:Endoglucanase-4 [Paramyrothecium foliicola]